MKMVTVEFHNRRRQVLFWSSVVVIVILLVLGPFLATYFLANGQAEITQTKVAANNAARAADAAAAGAASANKAAQGTQQLLEFVASSQTSAAAKANYDAITWYIKQFRAICAAEPGCKQVPLPPSVAAAHPGAG